jgi:hypothetical protein
MKHLKTKIYQSSIFFIGVILITVFFTHPIWADHLVSNVDGKIRVIIFHNGYGGYYSGFWFDETVLFRELVEKMDKDVGFVVLVGKDYKTDIFKQKLKSYESQRLPDGTPKVKYLQVDVKTSRFYPWARDGYFILTNENNDLIIQDSGFNESPFPITNFNEVFENVSTRAGYIHRGGGNVRCTDKEMFVGMDTILGEDATPRWSLFGTTEKTLYSLSRELKKDGLEAFKERFNAHVRLINYLLAPAKKIIIPGKEIFFSKLEKQEFKFTKSHVHHTGAQAAYHTDVYLGLGHINAQGQRVLFVADSNAGADIVEKMTPAERRQVEAYMPEVLAGEGFSAGEIPVTIEQIAQRFQWTKHKLLDLDVKPSREIGKILDQFAEHLESLGYSVIRIPCLANGLNNKEDSNDGLHGISFNYSNVLVEVYGTVKKVYLPQLGFEQMDQAAVKAYQEAGFQTVAIKGLLTNATASGPSGAGLDCMTSEIRFPVRWAKKYYKKDQ